MLYSAPIGDIVRSYDVNFHLYADDSQLYITFSTSSSVELDHAKLKMQSCVDDINKWMCMNKLKLNSDKTELLVLSSPYSTKPSFGTLDISAYDITPTSTARNIGVIFDEYLSLDSQISTVCKSSFLSLA